MKSDIWKDILSSIEQYNLPPESLCAELTESGYTDMTPVSYTHLADTQKEIDEKVVQLVKAEHEKARKILAENREKLDELAMRCV